MSQHYIDNKGTLSRQIDIDGLNAFADEIAEDSTTRGRLFYHLEAKDIRRLADRMNRFMGDVINLTPEEEKLWDAYNYWLKT